jgi:hypothetical protein
MQARAPERAKKELNPVEVRKDISRMVESHAAKMAQAVIGEGEKGQLATVRYLFEMAEIYPISADGSHATADELPGRGRCWIDWTCRLNRWAR